jgi:hypothetical protein
VTLLRQFATEHAIRLLLHGLLFIGLILLTRGARSWAHGAAAREGAPPAAAVFDRPYAAAAAAALVSVLWIYPARPRTIGDVCGILLLVPLLRILRPLIARAMAPVLYAFAVLILVDRVRAQLVVTPLGDQVVLLMGAPGVDGSLRPVARDQERPERCRIWRAAGRGHGDCHPSARGASATDMTRALVTIRPKSDTRPAMQKV